MTEGTIYPSHFYMLMQLNENIENWVEDNTGKYHGIISKQKERNYDISFHYEHGSIEIPIVPGKLGDYVRMLQPERIERTS